MQIYQDEGINYWMLGVTIYLSITFAGLTVGGAAIFYLRYEASVALKHMQGEAKAAEQRAKEKAWEWKMQSERGRKAAAKRANQQKTIQDRQANARRINQQTCQDWSNRYNKKRTQANKAMRDQACSKVGITY